MIHDGKGEPITYATAGDDAMWLFFPAGIAPMLALIPLLRFDWYFALIAAVMVISLVLRHLGVRGKDLTRGLKMLLIGGRRQYQSRRVLQRNVRGLRG